jgi:hypothetical protein
LGLGLDGDWPGEEAIAAARLKGYFWLESIPCYPEIRAWNQFYQASLSFCSNDWFSAILFLISQPKTTKPRRKEAMLETIDMRMALG